MEQLAKNVTLNVSHAVELVSAIIIAVAVLQMLWNYSRNRDNTRIKFGSSISIALELMLGADVLATVVAPDWSDIGKLAAIAAIRTVLNYFLEKELKHAKH